MRAPGTCAVWARPCVAGVTQKLLALRLGDRTMQESPQPGAGRLRVA